MRTCTHGNPASQQNHKKSGKNRDGHLKHKKERTNALFQCVHAYMCTSSKKSQPEERGDASCHGFWERGQTTIFDMRITNTDARSYRKKEFAKVLEQHEKEKKDKYLQNCLEMRKDVTPMVYSVDGIAGHEARNAEKRLATHLAGKWNHEYSQMVYYVRVRMAIAVVRANSLLICGSRD